MLVLLCFAFAFATKQNSTDGLDDVHDTFPTKAKDVFGADSSSSGCAGDITLSGASIGQTSRMGTYILLSQTNDGRPVYRYGDDYLYYHSANGKWYVGKTVGGTTVGIQATDSAMTPDLVTSGWRVFANSAWTTDTGITAE